jgi:hypothetical protein
MFKKKLYYSDGKKVPPFWVFIAPVAISLVVGIPLVTRYPIPIAIVLGFFIVVIILSGLCYAYVGFKIDRYVQKHDFHLWKKSTRHSYRDRREASKEIRSLVSQIPYLEKHEKYANKVTFILLSIWTLIFLGVFSFILFSALSG